jgi:hypothetical protein
MCARIIAFYIMDLSRKTLRNALFVDSIDSIIEKTAMMMRTATETEDVFWYFPIIHRLKRCFANTKESELLRWHKQKNKLDAEMITHPPNATQW